MGRHLAGTTMLVSPAEYLLVFLFVVLGVVSNHKVHGFPAQQQRQPLRRRLEVNRRAIEKTLMPWRQLRATPCECKCVASSLHSDFEQQQQQQRRQEEEWPTTSIQERPGHKAVTNKPNQHWQTDTTARSTTISRMEIIAFGLGSAAILVAGSWGLYLLISANYYIFHTLQALLFVGYLVDYVQPFFRQLQSLWK